ncbi:uncharacterized protein LOC110849671 isoform X2 [Folsomia candida]|uniref:uncharacterized protein LOC110849671 isoform X2 n=1 Tax=Folsomia candida TaxID=158441 RepID=UPI001604A5AD|nr:uncharacterized protein LOC110849671 isoform X2 [Folsomia candida]
MATNAMTEDIELTIRKLFNKLKPETFEQVLKDFTNIELNGKDNLIGFIVDIVMNKVVTKSNTMKADLFAKLISRHDKSFKLKKEILARCQAEFKLGIENAEEIKMSEHNLKVFQDVDDLTAELDRFKFKSIKCSVANVQLIGEFYNYDVAGTGAIMECVDALLIRNDEVSVTILCALMKTIGPKLYAIMELLKKDEEKPTKVNLPKMKEDAKFLTWVAKVFANLHTRSYSGWYLSLSSEAAVEEILKLQEKKWKTEEIISTPPVITAQMPVVNSTIPNNGADFLPILKQRKIDADVVKFLTQLNSINAPQIAQQFSSQPMDWYTERIVSIIYTMFDMSVDSLRKKSYPKSCANLVQILCCQSYRASRIFRKSLTPLCQMEIKHHKSYAIWLKSREDNLINQQSSDHLLREQLEDTISLGRKRFRGNVMFIGELFNLGILTYLFVKDTVEELMSSRDDGNLESLCMLLKTTGEKMHKTSAKCTPKMFKSMAILANSGQVSVAMKTVIMDVVNLSAKNWESTSNISKSPSVISISSSSTSGVLLQNDVTKELGKLTLAMSSMSVSKPSPVLENKEKEFELIRTQLEKSVDMMSSSNGESNMVIFVNG